MISVSDHHRLQGIARARWKSHKKRCDGLGVEAPDESDILILLIDSFNRGFTCEYCGKKMQFTQPPPARDVASLDHVLPLACGGTSRRDNLTICCTECNIVKSTLDGATFKMLVRRMGNEFKAYSQAIFNGRLAHKIERMELEKEDNDDNNSGTA